MNAAQRNFPLRGASDERHPNGIAAADGLNACFGFSDTKLAGLQRAFAVGRQQLQATAQWNPNSCDRTFDAQRTPSPAADKFVKTILSVTARQRKRQVGTVSELMTLNGQVRDSGLVEFLF